MNVSGWCTLRIEFPSSPRLESRAVPSKQGKGFGGLMLTSLELCAGAGGQALGLEQAGFDHLALVEIEPWPRRTLKHNRPHWNVIDRDGDDGVSFDLTRFSARPYRGGVDLLAGGVPCPPFSVAGKRLGKEDERDMFPHALRLVSECQPRAVMLENVRGLLAPEFATYRAEILAELRDMGYTGHWKLLNASDYGVPQLRPRSILVALQDEDVPFFRWPEPQQHVVTVGEALYEHMASGGWEGAAEWAAKANRIAPTLVGGSRKHGGPDLGPTRAREGWAKLGVDGLALADEPPGPGFTGVPRLTAPMTAIIQGFPADWNILGRKTPAYRQVGNALPPPVAAAVGRQIAQVLSRQAKHEQKPLEYLVTRAIVGEIAVPAD